MKLILLILIEKHHKRLSSLTNFKKGTKFLLNEEIKIV